MSLGTVLVGGLGLSDHFLPECASQQQEREAL